MDTWISGTPGHVGFFIPRGKKGDRAEKLVHTKDSKEVFSDSSKVFKIASRGPKTRTKKLEKLVPCRILRQNGELAKTPPLKDYHLHHNEVMIRHRRPLRKAPL